MSINPGNIIDILLSYFPRQPKTRVSETERNIATNIIEIIDKCKKESNEIEFYEELIFDPDGKYLRKEGNFDSDIEESSSCDDEPVSPSFSGRKELKNYKMKMVRIYRKIKWIKLFSDAA